MPKPSLCSSARVARPVKLNITSVGRVGVHAEQLAHGVIVAWLHSTAMKRLLEPPGPGPGRRAGPGHAAAGGAQLPLPLRPAGILPQQRVPGLRRRARLRPRGLDAALAAARPAAGPVAGGRRRRPRPARRCSAAPISVPPAATGWCRPGEADAHDGLCRACRLNRTIPDLDEDDNALLWSRIEVAKRRLVSQLLALGLPVRSTRERGPERGVMFDFLRAAAGQPRVVTGHADGLITLDVEEADDATRERLRNAAARALPHPARSPPPRDRPLLLGPPGGWQRLAASRFRARFGDERQDYEAALDRHYRARPGRRLAAALRQRLRQRPPLGGLGRDLGPLPAHARHAGHRG